jgi:hypothetical protein
VILFHVIASGRAWIETYHSERHWAGAGDVIVLPYGDGHRMGGTEPAEWVPVARCRRGWAHRRRRPYSRSSSTTQYPGAVEVGPARVTHLAAGVAASVGVGVEHVRAPFPDLPSGILSTTAMAPVMPRPTTGSAHRQPTATPPAPRAR